MLVNKSSESRAAQRDARGILKRPLKPSGEEEKGLGLAIAQMEREWGAHNPAPCSCGNINFLPAGNCFVCAVCGETSGCS